MLSYIPLQVYPFVFSGIKSGLNIIDRVLFVYNPVDLLGITNLRGAFICKTVS
ncbi:hypothetical protein Hanom_Chr10g00872701 [Helianthus anomalus]